MRHGVEGLAHVGVALPQGLPPSFVAGFEGVRGLFFLLAILSPVLARAVHSVANPVSPNLVTPSCRASIMVARR